MSLEHVGQFVQLLHILTAAFYRERATVNFVFDVHHIVSSFGDTLNCLIDGAKDTMFSGCPFICACVRRLT